MVSCRVLWKPNINGDDKPVWWQRGSSSMHAQQQDWIMAIINDSLQIPWHFDAVANDSCCLRRHRLHRLRRRHICCFGITWHYTIRSAPLPCEQKILRFMCVVSSTTHYTSLRTMEYSSSMQWRNRFEDKWRSGEKSLASNFSLSLSSHCDQTERKIAFHCSPTMHIGTMDARETKWDWH